MKLEQPYLQSLHVSKINTLLEKIYEQPKKHTIIFQYRFFNHNSWASHPLNFFVTSYVKY